MPEKEHEHYKAQYIIGCVLNSISILFCLIIIIPYWFRKSIHSFPLDLAILLCLTCCFGHICHICDLFIEHNKYIISILFFFGTSGCCLVTILSFTFFINLIYLNFIHSNKSKVCLCYILIALGIPLITSLIIFFNWEFDIDTFNLIMIMYLCIIWFFILLNFSILVAVIVKISDEIGGHKFYTKLILYGLAPVIAYIPNTIEMINGLVTENKMPGAEKYIVLFFNGLRGVWYTSIYAINSDIISCLNIFKKKEVDSEIENNNSMIEKDKTYSLTRDIDESDN